MLEPGATDWLESDSCDGNAAGSDKNNAARLKEPMTLQRKTRALEYDNRVTIPGPLACQGPTVP
jgi:hypothetical protein